MKAASAEAFNWNILNSEHYDNHVFATMPGFNCELPHEYGANDPYWQPWEVNEDLFDCMRVYYEQEEKMDNVKICEQGGECGSDDE